MKKNAKQNKHVKTETKKKQNKTKKLGFLGNGIMRTQILARKTLKMQKQSRTSEQRF